jgi:hypothetical protein
VNIFEIFSGHAATHDYITSLLGTLIINVANSLHQFEPVRALLDSASQRTFITASFAGGLGLEITPSSVQLNGINAKSSSVKGAVSLTILSPSTDCSNLQSQALVIDSLPVALPSENLEEDVYSPFLGLPLADPTFFISRKVDCLIGLDLFCQIVSSQTELLQFSTNGPSAMSTIFGYVVLGPLPTSLPSTPSTESFLIQHNNEEQRLDQALQKFWNTEEVPTVVASSPSDQMCEQLFTDTTVRTTSGRYVVALPFNAAATPLAQNRGRSYKMHLNMEKRIQSDELIDSKYRAFMQEYIELHHMSLATRSSNYIIPHHVIFKHGDKSGKIRVVFNGSSPDSTGISLNDRLLSGPKLQQDVALVINSFRTHQYIVVADCRMMYRQILVRPSDRHAQHIWYRPSPLLDVQEFELSTVTYGIRPSAWLAQRVLKQLVADEGNAFPLAAHSLSQHAYVDDLITGASTLEDAHRLVTQLVALLDKGGFELRKWATNCPELLKDIPPEHLENSDCLFDNSAALKILGIKFLPEQDVFAYNVESFSGNVTKRTVLSFIARVFDPVGWLSPVVFRLKCFMKRLWLAHLQWDDPLPMILQVEWSEFVNEFPSLSQLTIPRRLVSSSSAKVILGFCDASELGFGACLYLHETFADNTVSMKLIAAKSRVAPAQTVTIPRLELHGAFLLAKLVTSFQNSFEDFHILQTLLFTDAKIVLDWLHTPLHRLKIYIANRTSQILEHTSLEQWNHVSSADNAADVASRGLRPDELLRADKWWHGPLAYRVPIESFPVSTYSPSEPSSELKPPVTTTLLTINEPKITLVQSFELFSRLPRLIRVLARVLSFIASCRRHHPFSAPLLIAFQQEQNLVGMMPHSVEKLRLSLLTCVSLVQRHAFGSQLPTNLPRLCLFHDTLRLIRVGGRLEYSNLAPEAKRPLLLPKASHLSRLVALDAHLNTMHSGPRTTQAVMSAQFWVLSARSLVRSVIHSCLTCTRFRTTTLQPPMAPLPSARVTPSRPFSQVGVDFAGPFLYRSTSLRSQARLKGYLALFVCFATKAVHLEFVSSLCTDAFLASFQRFVSRRGLPADVYSDNGRNFRGAYRQLQEVYEFLTASQEEISFRLAEHRTKWHFNPPLAPHFGGLWEAAIKSAKTLLKRSIADTIYTLEEYATLFCRVEAILNSRPLTELSSDPIEAIQVLTPGHFLVGAPLLAVPETPIQEDISPTRRWTRLQQLAQHFWKRWSAEYLHLLASRNKWTRSSRTLAVGDLVLIRDALCSPLRWPVGVIVEAFPGQDNVVRVVNVRTAHGTYLRAVNRLRPLTSL